MPYVKISIHKNMPRKAKAFDQRTKIQNNFENMAWILSSSSIRPSIPQGAAILQCSVQLPSVSIFEMAMRPKLFGKVF